LIGGVNLTFASFQKGEWCDCGKIYETRKSIRKNYEETRSAGQRDFRQKKYPAWINTRLINFTGIRPYSIPVGNMIYGNIFQITLLKIKLIYYKTWVV
jgi:hypothetical protein